MSRIKTKPQYRPMTAEINEIERFHDTVTSFPKQFRSNSFDNELINIQDKGKQKVDAWSR